MIDDYINKLSNSNNNIGGGNVDNSCLLLYYSEKRRKFQAICLDFEKQKGFFREEKVWTGCGNVLSDPWKRGERLFQMGDSDRKIQIKLGL